MDKSTEHLIRLAEAGASLEVSGKTVMELILIACSLQPRATLTVLDAGTKPFDNLLEVVSAKPGQVILRSID